jgi:hypothetical protein
MVGRDRGQVVPAHLLRLLRDEAPEIPAQQLAGRALEITAVRAVHEGVSAIGKKPADQLGLVLHDAAVTGFALSQRQLGLFPLDDSLVELHGCPPSLEPLEQQAPDQQGLGHAGAGGEHGPAVLDPPAIQATLLSGPRPRTTWAFSTRGPRR